MSSVENAEIGKAHALIAMALRTMIEDDQLLDISTEVLILRCNFVGQEMADATSKVYCSADFDQKLEPTLNLIYMI